MKVKSRQLYSQHANCTCKPCTRGRGWTPRKIGWGCAAAKIGDFPPYSIHLWPDPIPPKKNASCSLKVRTDMHNSLVQPYFGYCNVIWSNCGVGLFEKTTEAPKPRSLYFLVCKQWRRYWDKLFQALGWRKLVATSVMMFKTLQWLTPEYLQFRFLLRILRIN